MKRTNIAYSLAVLTVIAGIGLASATFASTGNATGQKIRTMFTNQANGNKGVGHAAISQADKDARIATMTVKRTAVKAALDANDYNAWVIAVGPNSPLLTKINATNFSKLVDAYKLEVQADVIKTQAKTILTELGINQGEGRGEGMGMGLGLGLGMGLHLGLNK